MPTNIPGSAQGYPTNVVAPSTGDLRNAASVQVAFEDLADRTAWLRRNPSMAARNWTYHGGLTRPGDAITPAAIASGRFSAANPYETWMLVGDYASAAGASYSVSGAKAVWDTTGLTEADDIKGALYDPVNERWVLFGNSGMIHRADSANGSWVDESVGGSDNFYCGASGDDGRIVLAGNAIGGGTSGIFCRVSDDGGDTWAAPTAFPVFGGSGNVCLDMASGGSANGYVAGGYGTSNAPALWSSTDGDTWAVDTVPGGTTGRVTGVCASGAYFIAVTDDGEILRKSGGTWTLLTHGLPGTLDFAPGVASDPIGADVIVAVSSSGNPINVSTDNGATWEQVADEIDASFAPTAVMCSGTRWVIAGTGTEFDLAVSMAME